MMGLLKRLRVRVSAMAVGGLIAGLMAIAQGCEGAQANLDDIGDIATSEAALASFQLQPGYAPAAFARDTFANKKSIYALTANGRLAQFWDTDRWNIDFPAELAGHADLVFRGAVAVFPTDIANNKKSIYVATIDGRLAQIWDTNQWNLDFPAELAGRGDLRFKGAVAVFPTDPYFNKKSIYAITDDNRLAQIWDTDRWNVDFPAELAGRADLQFGDYAPAVFPTNAAANKKSIYVVTVDGRLAQVWDTDRWNLDFPAELAGQPNLRFAGVPAVFPTSAAANKKSIYAVTVDGRLAQIWDTVRWNLDFPAELAGYSGRFRSGAAVFPTNAVANKKSIYVVTSGRELAQIWDTDRWNMDFPARLAGQGGLRFYSPPAVIPMNPAASKKDIYLVDGALRLTQIWDTNRWNLDFPGN